MGFEPTRGDPIGLAGRRLSHSAKVSLNKGHLIDFIDQRQEAQCVGTEFESAESMCSEGNAETRDRSGDLQIFSLTLSQLSYRGLMTATQV